MNRGLIQMYDHYRGGKDYSFSNCKHLACTEVRAAMFSGKCGKNVSEYVKGKRDKSISDEICIKNYAIEHLNLVESCASKSKYFIEDVLNQCMKDRNPFSRYGSGKKASTGWLA